MLGCAGMCWSVLRCTRARVCWGVLVVVGCGGLCRDEVGLGALGCARLC